MRVILTKLFLLICFWALLLTGWWGNPSSQASVSNLANSQTGAPALGNFPAEQNCTACHAGVVNAGDGILARAATPATYLPNQESQITLSIYQQGAMRFGFQATALDTQGRPAGELVLTESQRMQISAVTSGPFAGRSYIANTANGGQPTSPGTNSWTFRWRAPAQKIGRVAIYYAVSAADGSGTPAGDLTYIQVLYLDPGVLPLATVSAASFLPDGAVAPESIVSGFGETLANTTVTANNLPLPTELGGLRVAVRDGNGTERSAPLFFVSPTQINYLVPAGTAEGRATVMVRRQTEILAEGSLQIEPLAPGLFAANASGQGVAAALALRVKADGQQSFEPVARLNPVNQRFEAVPLDLGSAGEQVFLILFGTGFRYLPGLNQATGTVGNLNAELLFAGAQGGLAGVDQANLRLPRALAGRGNVNILLHFGNKPANPLTIYIK